MEQINTIISTYCDYFLINMQNFTLYKCLFNYNIKIYWTGKLL